MRVLVALLSLLLLALPSFAQSAIDNCCQVNRSCAADSEWIQGWNDYQAGLCPASAPASSPGASPPAPAAAVDNCCQVNRSCTADAEWIQGWNDYQAGLCPVSAPAATSPPASAPAAPTAAVDNCCQVNRSCTADADWIQGWNDYQAGLCPVSAPAASSPAGSPPASSPPAETPPNVDNCCQVGRACHTDADWVQGYNDYQAGQCGGGVPAPSGGVGAQDHYSFFGTGRAATRVFALTRGTWRFSPGLGRNADTFLIQVESVGQANLAGKCLTFPSNWLYKGESGAGLRLAPVAHEFVVRYPCNAQFVVFGEQTANEVAGQGWKLFVNKVSGHV